MGGPIDEGRSLGSSNTTLRAAPAAPPLLLSAARIPVEADSSRLARLLDPSPSMNVLGQKEG